MQRRRFFQALLGVALLGVALVTPQSPASAATQGPYMIKGLQSGNCIYTPGLAGNGIEYQMYDCPPTRDYYDFEWYFVDTDSGYYNIRNRNTGGCITVLNNSTAQNQPIIQYTCNSGDNEEWIPIRQNPGAPQPHWYTLVSRRSGKCLTVKNASTANNAKLLQYTCNGGNNQKWTWYLGAA